MKHDKKTMIYQRRMLSLMGFLLPILAPIMGFIAYDKNGSEFWWSISATFYATSNIFMIGTLAIFAFFLYTYKGYDIGDNATCSFSATMALGILIFPCRTSTIGATTGVLNLPTGLSHVIHCIIATLLFSSFAYMIGYRFTKHDPALVLTDGKKKRNNIYHICAIIIAVAMVSQFATSLFHIGWMTIVNETVMLWAFSFAWAVKSDCFKAFIDRE